MQGIESPQGILAPVPAYELYQWYYLPREPMEHRHGYHLWGITISENLAERFRSDRPRVDFNGDHENKVEKIVLYIDEKGVYWQIGYAGPIKPKNSFSE